MSRTLFAALLFVASVLYFITAVLLDDSYSRARVCAARSGVLVDARSGFVCLRADAVIPLGAPPPGE